MLYIRYLERVLHNIQDPFDIAIVTYALTLANSPAQEAAFGKLHSLRRTDGILNVSATRQKFN